LHAIILLRKCLLCAAPKRNWHQQILHYHAGLLTGHGYAIEEQNESLSQEVKVSYQIAKILNCLKRQPCQGSKP
jgi:hypothetical protein